MLSRFQMIDNEVLELGNLSNKGHILPHETIHSLAQNTDLSQRSVNWQYVVLPESVNFETFLLLVFCWHSWPAVASSAAELAPGTQLVNTYVHPFEPRLYVWPASVPCADTC